MISRPGRHWAVAALLLLAFPVFADPADDLLTTGKKAFGSGQYALAVTSFQRVVSEFPESSRAEEAEYLLGVSLFYVGRWADSLQAVTEFRAHRPGSALVPRTLYWMGAANLKLGQYERALEYLAGAAAGPGGAESAGYVGADPYRPHARLLAGVAQESLGSDAEAAAYYRMVLSDATAAALFPEATFRLAGTEYRAGHFGSARDLYGRILLDNPQSAFVRDALFFLAECELALGNPAEAEKRYGTVLSLYPDSPYREAAAFRMADAAWRQKKIPQAVQQLDLFQKQFPNGDYRGPAIRLRADILFYQKKYEEALAQYQRAIPLLKADVDQQTAWYSAGLAQLALGRKSDAADSFARAVAGAPGTVAEKASFQRAVILAGEGSDAEAIRSLETYLAAFPDGENVEQATRLLADIREKTGNAAGSLALWDALVQRFARSASLPEYLFRRGRALLTAGRSAAALDDFQRVVREFPRSAWKNESTYAIGYVYTERGEYPRALPFFQSVAEDPGAGEVAERSRLSVGICLFNMGSFDKALTSLQELRAGKPKSVPEGTIVLYIGRTLYRMERLEEAAQRLTEAAGLLEAAGGGATAAQEGADARYWLAWSQLRLGRLVEARDAFLSVAQKYPSDARRAEALFRAGICETMRFDDVSAIALFDRVIAAPRIASGDDIREQALYERGWALSRLGRQAESADALESLAREFPAGRLAPQAFFKMAEKALETRRYAEALSGFDRVARDFPRSDLSLQALYWSAETARQSGDSRGALDRYWSCLAAGPEPGLQAATLEGFGTALRSTGSLELARQFAEKAKAARGLALEAVAGVQLDYADMLLASKPADALAIINDVKGRAPPEPLAGEASLLLGRYYAAMSDWGRAMDIFSALASSRADEIGARATGERARALEATGRTSEAVDEFLKVSYLFPDFPELAAEGLYHAAVIAAARGDKDRAAKIEQSLRAEFPGSPWIQKLDEQ